MYQARADSRIGILKQNIDQELWKDVDGDISNASSSKKAAIMGRDIVLCDNVLYQHTLGLIEESDYRRISRVVVRSFTAWEKEGLTDVYPRVRDCYEKNREADA